MLVAPLLVGGSITSKKQESQKQLAKDSAQQKQGHFNSRVIASGIASYYGPQFTGRQTASGERFDPRKLSAAHRSLRFGTVVKVTNPENKSSVSVRINDRGPFVEGRIIDLSPAAAKKIGLTEKKGITKVVLESPSS